MTQVAPFPQYSSLAQRFRIVRQLGAGGMGNVYLAEDSQLLRFVAIKTVRPELSADEEVKRRIAQECRIHAAIGVHPNIVALYDMIEEEGNIYLIMEYVEGILLSEVLSRQETLLANLSLQEKLNIIIQILEGISAVHQKEVIHRDIKPSNVIIKNNNNNNTGEYNVKLMDFGIARSEIADRGLTRLTTLDTSGPGTPMYMAPERIDPKLFGSLCAATDLYSVGVILFQMLSDGPPFRGTMTEIFIGHLTRPPDLTLLKNNIPGNLCAILEKSLQKFSEKRYGSARQFINDIKEVDVTINSDYANSPDNEKTLLITGLNLRNIQNEATIINTHITNKRIDLTPRNKGKLWAWAGFVAAVAICLVAVQMLAGHFSVENQKASYNEPKTFQQSAGQAGELGVNKPNDVANVVISPEQQAVPAPADLSLPNAKKQDSTASDAYERAKTTQQQSVGNQPGAVDQIRKGMPFEQKTVRPVSTASSVNKKQKSGSNCQSLRKKWQLGDTTSQEYQKECAN